MFIKSAFISELQRELGDSGDTNPEHTIRYGVWLDEVYQRIMNWWGWTTKELITTGTWSGDTNLALDPFTGVNSAQPGNLLIPNEVGQIVRIQREDGSLLPYAEKRELVEAEIDLRERGEAEVWYYGEFDRSTARHEIKLYPAPTNPYTVWVHGRLTPEQSLASSSVIPLPNEFIPALRDGVRALALEAEGQLEEADRIWARFRNSVELVLEMLEAKSPQDRITLDLDNDLEMLSPRSNVSSLVRPRTIPIP